MKNRVNISLIVAVLIPIAMVLFITASIYLPVLFIKPKYNFLYSTGDNYSLQFYYEVNTDRLERKEYPKPNYPIYGNNYKKHSFSMT